MDATHPEPCLSSKDWKSEALATMSYPSWHQNCKKAIKKEGDLPVSDTELTQRKIKPQQGSNEVQRGRKAAKRQKTVNILHLHDEVNSRQDRVSIEQGIG